MSIDSFVSAEIDTLANRPLLLMLGARDTPTGTKRLVDRIRALAACDPPPLHDLLRWYEALNAVAARAQPQELSELRKQFAESRLIRTDGGEWALASEVFCFADKDTLPDAATVYDSVKDLPLWKRLGVPDRPTLPLIIDWLAKLDVGSKLEPTTARRVQACLKAYPTQVYNQVNAWLSLDNRWLQLDQFRFAHHSGTGLRISDLFVAAKSHTADLRGVPAEKLESTRFAGLPDLNAAISYVISDVFYSSTLAHSPDWLIALGGCLARFAHESPEVQERIRRHAQRMTETAWQEIVSIKVTPYLDDTPVGQPSHPTCLWTDRTLFVGSPSLVEIIDDLVDELQRPFDLPVIAEAIRICIDRPSNFIQQYLNEKFDLQPIPEPIPAAQLVPRADQTTALPSYDDEAELTSLAANDNPVEPPDADTNIAPKPMSSTTGVQVQQAETITESEAPAAETDHDDTVSNQPIADESNNIPSAATNASSSPPASEPFEPNAETEPSEPPEKRQRIIERFAELRGFTFDPGDRVYYSSDGSRMHRCGGAFGYEIYDPSGRLTCQVWLTPQTLSMGFEVPADVWEMIRTNPTSTSIACEDQKGQVCEITGTKLMQMIKNETIRLFPAKYRLRQIADF